MAGVEVIVIRAPPVSWMRMDNGRARRPWAMRCTEPRGSSTDRPRCPTRTVGQEQWPHDPESQERTMKTISAERVDLSRSLDLEVQRSGIRFHNIAPDQVRIEIEVENHGSSPSEPTSLRIEAALFGAFLPWRPLAALPVPTIPAGGMALVETVARQPRPK